MQSLKKVTRVVVPGVVGVLLLGGWMGVEEGPQPAAWCVPCEHWVEDLAYIHHFGSGIHYECAPSPYGCHWSDYYGLCGTYHFFCAPQGPVLGLADDNPVEILVAALDRGEPDEVDGLLHQYRDIMYYVPERNAIQVLGCQGTVDVHVPLTPAQVALIDG